MLRVYCYKKVNDMKTMKHLAVTIIILFLIIGIPFMNTSYFKQLITENTDAQTSASVITDKPSGNYKVIINLDKHTDKETLSQWHDFFEGEDVSFIFEDIVCTVADGDSTAMELAENFRSRLPENQMIIKTEDPVLMLSKAEYGLFDVVIISEEFANIFNAETVYSCDFADVININDNTQDKETGDSYEKI